MPVSPWNRAKPRFSAIRRLRNAPVGERSAHASMSILSAISWVAPPLGPATMSPQGAKRRSGSTVRARYSSWRPSQSPCARRMAPTTSVSKALCAAATTSVAMGWQYSHQ